MPSTDNKADMLFKIALGFADTGNAPGKTVSKEFYAEGIPSRPTVYSSSVWSEVDKIPVDAPAMTPLLPGDLCLDSAFSFF